MLIDPNLFREPIAHRGLHDLADHVLENTQTAFQRAIERDFSIECDVRLSGDNQVVVFHDDMLDRLTDGTGNVWDKTVADLKSIPFHCGTDRIQTLPELLEQVAGEVPIIIEMKSRWNGLDDLSLRVAEALSAYQGLAATMSFDPVLVAASKRHMPHLPHGIVSELYRDTAYWAHLSAWQRMTLRNLLHWRWSRPDFISFQIRDLPHGPVSWAQRFARVPVICWTVRTRQDQLKARKYCDQITFEGFDPRQTP